MAEQRGSNRRNGKLSARDAVTSVRDDFPALLGRPVESILGVERDEEGGWVVTVQVVELRQRHGSTHLPRPAQWRKPNRGLTAPNTGKRIRANPERNDPC